MSAAAIGSLAPWFGSKRTLAPAIVSALGPHNVFWDVFCGSMAILLAKQPCKTEVVNDLHGDLINLARVIQDRLLGPELYRRLRRVWSSEELFRTSLDVIRREQSSGIPDLDRAFHYFVASWQGMNGVAGTGSFNTNYCRRFTATGGDAGARWAGAVRSIPAWRRRMERVQILSGCGIELCERIEDADGTVIYCDPPYLKKGAAYLHDFSDPAPSDPQASKKPHSHERLAIALSRFRRTRVVVSYYEDPYLERLYPDWRRRQMSAAKGLVNSGRRGKEGWVAAPEILLTNLPWPDDRGLFD